MSIYRMYWKVAASRGRAFDLTRDQFEKLSLLDCHYCGAPPAPRLRKRRDQPTTEVKAWTGNGIDRVDNLRGYTLDNVVPCCRDCNRMKMDLTLAAFREKVAKIHARFTVT